MFLRKLIAVPVLFLSSLTANAALIDLGASGEYFRDTNSGLFWWDPANFVGQTKAQIDTFVSSNPNWKYASAAEIDGLLGQSSVGGIPLTDVMGAPQFITFDINDGNGARWVGYFDETTADPGLPGDPDGWNVQTVLGGGLNDLTTIGDTGFQNDVANWDPGAWINSRINPVPVPAAVWLFGTALLGFIGYSRRRNVA